MVTLRCLLYVSQAAGNPSHAKEIISSIEEMRKTGIIYEIAQMSSLYCKYECWSVRTSIDQN